MSLRNIVSNKVTHTIRIKNASAPINNNELNFTSQYSPIKKAATRNAFTEAITRAVITSKGAGIDIEDTTTVNIVSITKAPPIR
ncbi:MAG: hypothetical protein BalsKO_20070 [Balneolaceae bacterium]